jgi:hypothetical protein
MRIARRALATLYKQQHQLSARAGAHVCSVGRNEAPCVLRWQCMRMAQRALATLYVLHHHLSTRAGAHVCSVGRNRPRVY